MVALCAAPRISWAGGGASCSPSLARSACTAALQDEADEMLSRGFKDQIYDIFQLLPPKIQVSTPASAAWLLLKRGHALCWRISLCWWLQARHGVIWLVLH